MRRLFPVVAAVLLTVVTISCTQTPEELLVGTWDKVSQNREEPKLFYPSELRFLSDGTVGLLGQHYARGSMATAGKYDIIESKVIKFNADHLLTTLVNFTVDSEWLTLEFPRGEVVKYRRR